MRSHEPAGCGTGWEGAAALRVQGQRLHRGTNQPTSHPQLTDADTKRSLTPHWSLTMDISKTEFTLKACVLTLDFKTRIQPKVSQNVENRQDTPSIFPYPSFLRSCPFWLHPPRRTWLWINLEEVPVWSDLSVQNIVLKVTFTAAEHSTAEIQLPRSKLASVHRFYNVTQTTELKLSYNH